MDVVRKGHGITLACAGNMLSIGMQAWNKLNEDGKQITLLSISDWSDLHPDEIKAMASNEHLVTLEDHNVKTGLGTAISSAMMEQNVSTHMIKLGVTEYASSGKPADLYKSLGMDADSVVKKIRAL